MKITSAFMLLLLENPRFVTYKRLLLFQFEFAAGDYIPVKQLDSVFGRGIAIIVNEAKVCGNKAMKSKTVKFELQ
ncbi:hypothetical protein L2E82_25819 [Cichorium intybus]|uniref:Uncharacterized protein n=2 Tax=Cichorium intybus TaxID=13427 RepID=A0ACB9E596_CICIN|nr:hypothetical protein L2E82_25815 [Cichorium intybus]KAI3753757.1 hypothetical protein L2E82_25819 [Cichorium intybus]